MSTRVRWRAVLITLIVMMGLWYFYKDQPPEPLAFPAQSHPPAVQVSMSPDSKPLNPKPAELIAGENKADSNHVAKNFTQALERFLVCFSLSKGEISSDSNPKLEDWEEYLQTRLGETVFNTEEWRNTEIQMPNGEKRRIRIEYDMGENDEYVKKLKYSIVNPDNTLTSLAVASEHSENPTESFIESIEKEGDVISFERAHRVYFKDGTELYAVESAGVVKDVEINKDGKHMRCSQLDVENLNCECF